VRWRPASSRADAALVLENAEPEELTRPGLADPTIAVITRQFGGQRGVTFRRRVSRLLGRYRSSGVLDDDHGAIPIAKLAARGR